MDTDSFPFVVAAFLFQIILIGQFALRKWFFTTAMRYGRIVYALSIPAAIFSLYLCPQGKPWYLWAGGFIYLTWAIFGYVIEYRRKFQWRNPP